MGQVKPKATLARPDVKPRNVRAVPRRAFLSVPLVNTALPYEVLLIEGNGA